MKRKIYFGANDDIVDIRNDNVFKAVFTKNTPASQGALSKLVSALIDRDVSIIEILANEPPPDSLIDRQIRYDISCRAENGELINVEMSLYPDPFEPLSMEYYCAKVYSGQDIRGKDRNFDDLMSSFQITIIGNDRFFPDNEFYHVFEYYDSVNRISLGGRTRIISCELSKLKKIAEKPTEEMNYKEKWAVFLGYLTDKKKRSKINELAEQEEGIAMASEVLMGFSKTEAERLRKISEEKAQMRVQNRIVTAKREAEKEGMLKGEQIGQRKIIELLKKGKSPEEIIREYDV